MCEEGKIQMKNYSRLMKLAEKWFKLGTEGYDYLIRPNLLTSTRSD